MRILFILSSIFYLNISACGEPKPIESDYMIATGTALPSISYLALGDSYTIGEAVDSTHRWPVQLADSLRRIHHLRVDEPQIVATTGWTTNELQHGIEQADLKDKYELISLLIGVNNQYRGYAFEQFEKEYEVLIKWAIQHSVHGASGIFAVSIPNYGVTPFGQARGEDTIRAELLAYDAKAKEICQRFGIPFFDITPISELTKDNPTFIADDQLHPSGLQYTEWVRSFASQVAELISDWPVND
ncbi:SGNH/GDSL hydrolase family protein [Balneolaceae bacterium]|jgi:lysophospholipase L1-like esterase|nr:SGNH/GDSL hydrolase family protein [Balneolaceae bacterium]